MNNSLFEDYFRVTSIPYQSSGLVIFSGVPLKPNSYRVNDGKYYVTIKSLPEKLPIPPAIGQHWSVKGLRELEDKEIGDYVMQQHTYDSPAHVECSLPETGEQLIRFIANERDFKGIGESKARALYELLGADFHKVMQSGGEREKKRLRSVLSEDSITALFEGYAKYQNLSHSNWMSNHDIPSPIQQRLLKFHNENSIQAIKDNPFLLIGFGMSFREVDQLAQTKFGVKLNDARRLSAALESAIRREVDKGHTYTKHDDLRPVLRKLLGDGAMVAEAFKAGYDKAQYLLNPESGSYHPTAQLLMESVVSKRLLALRERTNLYDAQAKNAYSYAIADLPYQLTHKQSDAVLMTLNNAISCITGGAGTGKTTVLRTALRAYDYMGFQIHAAALAGRAAMRLHESIGFETMTIAALLRKDPVAPTPDNTNYLVVIDEASMLDLPTMYRIVNHLNPAVRIIFTGDPDQLPPIGCGKVLADIVDSKVIANTELDIVKRQKGSSGIPEYSKQVNQGKIPSQLTTGNIYFHQTAKSKIVQVCTDLYKLSPESSRILGATKAMVADINKSVQRVCNPKGKMLEFNLHGENFYLDDFREGDTVLFTKNHYDKGVQNGSLGKLVNVATTETIFGEVELDTGEIIELSQSLLDSTELGYCITLHKAQGSQFPRIIIALQKGRIVDRAWLYTALTRAEHEVHIVGDEADFTSITERQSHSHQRNSFLSYLLSHNKQKVVGMPDYTLP